MAFSELLVADEEELAEHYPTPAEKAADGIVHAIGILAALVGGGLLIAVALINRGVPMATAGAIYAMCLMAMLAASAVYNLTKPSPYRRVLRRIDEAAIFLMIAGSYTPFTIKLLPPDFAIGVTVAIWLAALAGFGARPCCADAGAIGDRHAGHRRRDLFGRRAALPQSRHPVPPRALARMRHSRRRRPLRRSACRPGALGTSRRQSG